MRSWLAQRFHRLFEREAALYRQIVSRISSHAGQYQQLPDLLDFVEEQTTSALNLRRVRILVGYRRGVPKIGETQPNKRAGLDSEGDAVDASLVTSYAANEAWVEQVLDLSSRSRLTVTQLPIRFAAKKTFLAFYWSMRLGQV
jgi:hypothetical protein